MKADFPSQQAFARVAARLRCEVAAIKAVSLVEAGPEGAFLSTDEPTLLFEPHIFSRLTNRKYDGYRMPGVALDWGILSRHKWMPGTYGPMSKQHARMDAAARLDRNAALQSASWGLFQIMGMNYKSAGFLRLQDFVNAMYASADDHLEAFANLILTMDVRLAPALRDKDWPTFSRIYNGSGYKTTKHHVRMAWNYNDLTSAA